jgi:hypothetical protein
MRLNNPIKTWSMLVAAVILPLIITFSIPFGQPTVFNSFMFLAALGTSAGCLLLVGRDFEAVSAFEAHVESALKVSS